MARRRRRARVTAVGSERPRLGVVGQIGLQVVEDAIAMLLALDREADLDAPEEVALHPVGARAEDLGIAVVVKVEDARVFEEAARRSSGP